MKIKETLTVNVIQWSSIVLSLIAFIVLIAVIVIFSFITKHMVIFGYPIGKATNPYPIIG